MRTLEDAQKIVEAEPDKYGNAGLLKLIQDQGDDIAALKSALNRAAAAPVGPGPNAAPQQQQQQAAAPVENTVTA
jgi:hypothetical protein